MSIQTHQTLRFIRLSFVCFLMTVLALPQQATAQRRGINLVRDAEIEALIKSYAAPLMKAAGLRRNSVNFHIVNDNSFNAFVSGRGMFINAGLILQSETPGEVIGVIAHELGHIIGAHQIRLRERLDQAARVARWTTLLGLGIGAAGAASGSSSAGAAGLAVAQGGGSVALRGVLKYQRGEESSADRTAARLLRKTKQSGRGMLRTFKRLQSNLSLGSRRNSYKFSHPLPRERIASLQNVVRESPYYSAKTSTSLKLRHDMARAKLAAYVGGARYSRAILGGKTLHPNARLYGRAITTHLYGSPRKAIPMIDRLLKVMPRNAYVHEMRGEIMLRSGKAANAAQSFRKAVKLDRTGAGFIRIELGHALVQSGKRNDLKKAVVELRKGLARDPTATAGYQYLAIAYGGLGDEAQALLASGEFALRRGRRAQAKDFARRAQQQLKRGSPAWLRAQDIITYK